MKNIHNKLLIFSLMTTLFVVSGCLVDEQWDIKNGGYEAAIMYPQTDAVYLDGETTSITVDFNPFINEGVSITSVNVTKQLFTAAGDSDPVEIPVSGETFTQSSSELFADVPVNGKVLSEDDLEAGDNWKLSYTMIMGDGTVLNIGDQTKILFTCPSYLAGTYDAVGSGNAGGGYGPYPSDGWDGTQVVTLTELSLGVYEIDHMAGGFYPNFWGGDVEPNTLREVCGAFSIDKKSDQWGDTFTSTVTNNGNGSMTVSWSNTYGDGGTYTLTPQ